MAWLSSWLLPPEGEARRALRVLALLALALVAFVALSEARHAPAAMDDWQCYYRAAEAARAGGDLYADAKAEIAHHSYERWNTTTQYPYPPVFAYLLVPLTFLGPWAATRVWLAIVVLGGVVLVRLILGCLGRAPTPEAWAVAALPVLASTPFLLEIRCGQVDVLLACLLVGGLWAHLEGRDVAAGCLAGLAATVKPMLAAYLLFYLLKRRWKLLGTAIVTGLAVGLGPFLFLPRQAFLDWVATCLYYSSPSGNVSYPYNQASRGLLLRAFSGGPTTDPLWVSPAFGTALWMALAVAAVGLAGRVVVRPTDDRRQTLVQYSLLTAALLFAGPQSEDLHYTHLLLPLALLADTIAWRRSSPRLTLWALAACLYFVQPWLNFAYLHGGRGALGLVFSGAYLYGLALVVVPALWLAWREAPPAETA